MTTYILTAVKYFVLVLSSFYAFVKLGKIKLKVTNLIDVIFALIFGTAMAFCLQNARLLVPLVLLIVTIFYMFVRYRQHFYNTVILGTIACGIALLILTISGLLSLPFGRLIFEIPDENVRNIITIGGVSLVQLIVVFVLFQIKRFKSGISLYKNEGNIEILLLISVLCIFLNTLLYTKTTVYSVLEICIITLTFCGTSLIITWRKHLLGLYRKKILERNEKLDRQRIARLENESSELMKRNEELAGVIHRDNKLLPAMIGAVDRVIEKCPDDEEIKTLSLQLKNLASERSRLLENYIESEDRLCKTGIFSVDSTLRFIMSAAAGDRVEAGLDVAENINETIKQSVDLTEFSTIICDLGENAINSAKATGNGKIFIELKLTDRGEIALQFYDNGAPFDKNVIANLGKEKFTTRKSDGGSGIGLDSLFNMLPQYNASFCLDENPDKSGFTKSITISFDNANEYKVKTEREEIKKILELRSDFYRQN